MNIIAVVSAKGGVGKTTFSANLGTAISRVGLSVVAVDLDPQDSLRLHFGLPDQAGAGLAGAALSGSDLRKTLRRADLGCEVLPFGRIDEEGRESFEQLLRDQPRWLLQNLSQLDLPEDAVVIIDTPPGPSVYLRQALQAANFVLVVLLADAASYATLPMMIRLIKKYCLGRPNFIDYSYLINQIDHSRQLVSDVAHVMRTQFGERSLATVHQDQAIPEALACNQFVRDYDPHSRGAHDLTAACAQLLACLPARNWTAT